MYNMLLANLRAESNSKMGRWRIFLVYILDMFSTDELTVKSRLNLKYIQNLHLPLCVSFFCELLKWFLVYGTAAINRIRCSECNSVLGIHRNTNEFYKRLHELRPTKSHTTGYYSFPPDELVVISKIMKTTEISTSLSQLRDLKS